MKALAIGGGLMLGLMLSVIGFGMVGPGGPNTYAGPMQVGMASALLLPIAYWFVAARKMPPVMGTVLVGVMALVGLSLWLPLIEPGWMRNTHSGVLAIWSAVWGAAALPFLRLAVRGLRRSRR